MIWRRRSVLYDSLSGAFDSKERQRCGTNRICRWESLETFASIKGGGASPCYALHAQRLFAPDGAGRLGGEHGILAVCEQSAGHARQAD
jgi:hypothetical protein